MATQYALLDKRSDIAPGKEATARDLAAPDAEFHPEALDCLSSDLAVDGTCAVAYNEDAFRYFLEIERRRSEASARPLLLLLVDLKKQIPPEASMPAATAERLFTTLAGCLRDTDFVGWYHEGRVIGAVLTQDTESSDTGIAEMVAGRVTTMLNDSLPPSISVRVQVRIYQLPSVAAR
jgi:hypothetical protein